MSNDKPPLMSASRLLLARITDKQARLDAEAARKPLGRSLMKIGQASRALGVCVVTLRRWEKAGLIKPIRLHSKSHRYYKVAELKAMIAGESEAKP